MNRFDFRCRGPRKLSVGVGPQPRRGERAELCPTGFGEEFLFVLCFRRILSQSQIGHLLYWAIALGSPDHRAVRHDPTMAFRTGYLADLKLSPLSNDVECKWAHAIFVIQVAGLRNKGTHLLSSVGLRAEEDRCVEDDFAGFDPVFLGHQLGTVCAIVPQNNGLLLSKPIRVSERFLVWVIFGIALVDRP